MRVEKYYNYIVRRFIVENKVLVGDRNLKSLKNIRIFFKINSENLTLMNFLSIYRDLESLIGIRLKVSFVEDAGKFFFYADLSGLRFWKSMEVFYEYYMVEIWKERILIDDTLDKEDLLIIFPSLKDLTVHFEGLKNSLIFGLKMYYKISRGEYIFLKDFLRVYGISI